MQTYIALLRGINVSGQKKIKMAEFRSQLEEDGFQEVETYIQSGNVIFSHKPEEEKILAKKMADLILEKYGFEVPVLVLIIDYLKQVFEQNPFTQKSPEDIKTLHVTLCAETPQNELVAALQENSYSPDEWILQDKAIYLNCPNGYGRTKLTNTFFERKFKVSATTRNWKTMTKLLEMTEKKT